MYEVWSLPAWSAMWSLPRNPRPEPTLLQSPGRNEYDTGTGSLVGVRSDFMDFSPSRVLRQFTAESAIHHNQRGFRKMRPNWRAQAHL